MNNIIITICNLEGKYDLEVPVTKKMDELSKDILENMKVLCPNKTFKLVKYYNPRLNRIINNHETLATAKIFNGDYLEMIEYE